MKRLALLLALVLAPSAHAFAPGPERYGESVERDVAIPMADGVNLRADVYRPAGPDGKPAPGSFPVLVSQTPYGKDKAGSVDILSGHRPYLVKRGYVQVIVDVRGQGASQGSFQLFGPAEQSDGPQVVRWAARLPGTTGKVGLTGESYLAIDQLFTAAAMGRRSPLKAIFPIVPSADPYRDLVFSGGLLNLESNAPLVGAYGALQIASPLFGAFQNPGADYSDIVSDRVRDVLTGFSAQTLADISTSGDRAYDGRFWNDARQPDDQLARIVRNRIPAFMVGGLYDVFQRGEPLLYSGLQNAYRGRPAGAPMGRRQRPTPRYQLLIKPQYHSTIDNGKPSLDELQLAWFDHWLKGAKTGVMATKTPLRWLESDGTAGAAKRFPVERTPVRRFALGRDGTDTIAFAGASLPCDRSTEQWSLGVFEIAYQGAGAGDPCGDRDLAPASAGPAQLVYDLPAFKRDRLLAGPSAATLVATANTADTEWVAKLSDVAPDGTSVDLTQGALLGSHRALDPRRTWRRGGRTFLPYHPHTKAAQTPVPAGKPVRYDVELRSMFATLRKGHHLRLTLLTGQSPHLLPLPLDLPNLVGGVYALDRAKSSLQVPLR